MVAAEVAQESNNPAPFEMEFIGRPVCPDPTGGPDRGGLLAHVHDYTDYTLLSIDANLVHIV